MYYLKDGVGKRLVFPQQWVNLRMRGFCIKSCYVFMKEYRVQYTYRQVVHDKRLVVYYVGE